METIRKYLTEWAKAWVALITPIVTGAITDIIDVTQQWLVGIVVAVATALIVWITPNREVP